MSNRLLFDKLARLRLPYPFASPPVPVRTRIRDAWRRHRSRRRIALLDSHALKDIGVSFAEAEAEANRWFWRA
jgi:uncharacterized protein YjiS (DUF1127 family)